MATIKERFDKWIKRHKRFAMAVPIVGLLLIFFVVTSLKSLSAKGDEHTANSGYNNSLPNQKSELEVKDPNEYYKQSLKDSLEQLREYGRIQNINDTRKENDSLERILEELNNFSLDEADTNDNGVTKVSASSETPQTEYTSKMSAAEEKLEYRKLLMEARDERLSRSQDYSAPYVESSNKTSGSIVSIDAAIYRDQFILPGNRVKLILKEDISYNGKRFRKNTFVYATSNIQASRIILEVTNIDNVKISLTALDQEDGMIGLHNERAGELMQEFKANVEQEGENELSEAVGESTEMPLARNLIRSFGNFFQKKKYKERDKILLVNGDRVFLVPKA